MGILDHIEGYSPKKFKISNKYSVTIKSMSANACSLLFDEIKELMDKTPSRESWTGSLDEYQTLLDEQSIDVSVVFFRFGVLELNDITRDEVLHMPNNLITDLLKAISKHNHLDSVYNTEGVPQGKL